jgi:hypothetical protein
LHGHGGLAERIAAKHTVDVDAAQPEDIAHTHLRGDRRQIRLDLVEDRPLALGVQVAKVERELVAAPGSTTITWACGLASRFARVLLKNWRVNATRSKST